MLKLNATVWQQKLNIKDIVRLRESSRQKETGKVKNDPEKNVWGRLKRDGNAMGNGPKKQKKDIHGEKGIAALSWMDRTWGKI